MGCSFFVQSGEGAVFAMVPLVKRRLTGQVAGMAGAYGNVGAVSFLTVLSFVSPQAFFMVIAGAAIVTWIAIAFFLDEPEGGGVSYFDARTALDDRVFPSKEQGSLRLSEERVVEQFQKRINQVDFTKPQFFYLNIQAAHFPYSHPKMAKRIVR